MQVGARNFVEEFLHLFGFGDEAPAGPGTGTGTAAAAAAAAPARPESGAAERNLVDRDSLRRAELEASAATAPARFDYGQIQGVANNPNVTPGFLREVEAVAGRIGTRPEYLMSVMSFETGGTFNPGLRNGIGATGLIQFLPSTARALGTTTAELARMTPTEQLRYVEKYFDQPNFRGRLGSLEGLYTSVLSGRARQNSNDVLFERGTRAYDQNPLDWNRDGRITVGEAITPVAARMYGGVRGVQRRLADLGFVPEAQRRGFADGSWGPNSSNALRRFQEARGLPATGLLDDATGRALFGRPAVPAPVPAPVLTPTEPPTTPDRTLAYGSRGADVERLQNNLVRLGFMSADQKATGAGIFGPRTQAAVEKFQRAANLPLSGFADNATRTALRDLTSGIGRATPGSNRHLTQGVQDRLVALGYMTRAQVATGAGTFGPRTEAAVRAFQSHNGLPPTGRVGDATFRELFSAGARPAVGAPGVPETPANAGRNYSVAPNILITEELRPRLDELAARYHARTGRDLHVTSGYRPPSRQANAMYDLIQQHGTQYVRNLYGNKGAVGEILSAYGSHSGSRASAVAAMTQTIEAQVGRGVYISDHLRSRAIDFSTSADFGALRSVVTEMGGRIINEHNHFHVEL